ncbi:DUF317 domain-containing protein [Streptomyces stelliscabiei]|uniref:DUF317 domain-containing protein n=1 Tax=Streptomyces stelliscabiei TaxID=146820 RepID=UPI002FEFEBB4
MPDTEEIDGDVYVTPRYLAGTTWTGDPALAPLLALGWDLQHDENGNVYVTAPDRKVRLGYLPEGPDDGLWRITAYEDPFAQPKWGASFNSMCPTEFVTAFTAALADAYTTGPAVYLPEPADDPELDAFRAVAPLIQRGWAIQHPRWGVLEVRTPDGLASLEYTTGRLDAGQELTTLQARWYLQGGPACCPALKMPTEAAFTMPMNSDSDAPPVGVPAGRSSARCRFLRQGAGCAGVSRRFQAITVERWCSPHLVPPG